ncbi:hypothetical protein OsI_14468 [Oryza sativa Indica Group]|uniref:DUF4220 domain-containing protein n=1 Tax=Oryza sativa subsp. indica TaxID=39946 RepID=B8AP83_ORYSI|nr:hypothetical protein OsI_14468 [Oryza sativa Indica Group]
MTNTSMSSGSEGDQCNYDDVDFKQIRVRILRTNVVLVFSLITVAILVGASSFSRRYRRHGLIRLISVGAYTLFLPLVSYVVSGVDKENCALPDGIDECTDDSSRYLLVWASVVQIVGANYCTAIAADDNERQNIAPIVQLLVGAIWTLVLVINHFNEYSYDASSVYWFIWVPCALTIGKVLARLYAHGMARRSFEIGRNPRLVAGYMRQLNLPRRDDHAIPLLVMGEDKQDVEEGPRGYRFTNHSGNNSLVTMDRITNMTPANENVLNSQFKDVCLSFSLFKLLRQRFARCLVVEEDYGTVPNFTIKLRHGDPQAQPQGIRSPLMQRLICRILRFRCKMLSNSYKMGQASIMDTNMKVVKAVRRLLQLADEKMKYVEIQPEVNTAILDKFRANNWRLPTVNASLQQSRIGNDILWACNGKGTSDVILVWHIATCIFQIKHPYEGPNAPAITASQLSRYCAYLLSSAPELLPDDKAWSKKLYKSVKKITEPIFSKSNTRPVQYEHILQKLDEI